MWTPALPAKAHLREKRRSPLQRRHGLLPALPLRVAPGDSRRRKSERLACARNHTDRSASPWLDREEEGSFRSRAAAFQRYREGRERLGSPEHWRPEPERSQLSGYTYRLPREFFPSAGTPA